MIPSAHEEDLLLRSRAYSYFSALFLAEPPKDLTNLRDDTANGFLSSLFKEDAVAAWRRCVAECDPESLRKEFHALFTAPMGRYVFPYESCYRVPEPPGPLMGPPAVAIQEAYASAGLSTDPEAGEAPDHIGLELMFAAYLLEQAAVMAERRKEFLILYEALRTEHLTQWLPALAARIDHSTQSCFYSLAAGLAVTLVTRDVEAAG